MESIENSDDQMMVPQSSNAEQEQEEDIPTRLIPGYETFEDYVQGAFDAMRAGIRAANNLPTGENYNYYACFPGFNNARNKDIKRILSTMQTIVKLAGGSGNIEKRDIEEKFDLLLETNDLLLDRASICMDEESGILKNPVVELVVSQIPKQVVNSSWNTNTEPSVTPSKEPPNIRLLAGKNVQRPQLMFKDKIDNSSKPWQPRIKEKPNSLKPLAVYIEEDGEVFNHPYEFELDRFKVPERQLKKSVPIQYKSLDDTRLIMIETVSDLQIVLDDLKNYDEIAVDLEHHSYRTFQGITCLLQISTVDTDYLIDTLILRSELHQLNEIFTKPSILKVFHGADSDIQWLQRDLSLYVVNMFDTHQAAKQLNSPYLSLAYLLKKYCGIDPNKHFQLADWRIRPLPEELMKYAREDTHYLLYIKDILKNELIEAGNDHDNILKAVYYRSTEICKRTYVKPIWTEESCINMYRKSHKMFNNKQMYALKELHRWRDIVAREEDDSIGYVLPNHMLLNIAETLPREIQGILACCNPIPPLVRQNLLKLHKVVLKAREQPLVKSIPEQDFRQRLTQRSNVNFETWIHSPHDIPSDTEVRADLPCLLDNIHVPLVNVNTTMKHTVTVFDMPIISKNEDSIDTEDSTFKKALFISPFRRYQCVIPMIAEEEAKERDKEEERRKKKEEESCPIEEETKKEDVEQNEINESKNRVYEHFKQITQSLHKRNRKSSKKKYKHVTLGQMHGRKRKRESDIMKQEVKQEKPDFSTPAPSLDARITYMPKKAKLRMQNAIEEHKVQVQDNRNSEVIKPIRSRKKGDKKAITKLLQQRDMLPTNAFDYKSVDFTSFQGGSMVNNADQTKFRQPKQKRKEKPRKWKKQKFNI